VPGAAAESRGLCCPETVAGAARGSRGSFAPQRMQKTSRLPTGWLHWWQRRNSQALLPLTA